MSNLLVCNTITSKKQINDARRCVDLFDSRSTKCTIFRTTGFSDRHSNSRITKKHRPTRSHHWQPNIITHSWRMFAITMPYIVVYNDVQSCTYLQCETHEQTYSTTICTIPLPSPSACDAMRCVITRNKPVRAFCAFFVRLRACSIFRLYKRACTRNLVRCSWACFFVFVFAASVFVYLYTNDGWFCAQ